MATIIEHAGGKASTGMFRGTIMPILDLCPGGVHEKCPVIVGCNRDVDRVLGHYA
jgi:fructose-1,6-bisphosphatase I